jgi:predicted secreted protein
MRRYNKQTTRIRTSIGKPFVVELPVHASAGYTWQLIREPETARLRDARIRPTGAAVGGSSVQEFEFVATCGGEGILIMACKRPWETTVIEQFEVKVVAEAD